MTEVSDVRWQQKHLKVGDRVVVYVPWQTPVDWRPYWEGKIVEAVNHGSGTAFLIKRENYSADKAEGPFHHRYCFPERLRDKVRYTANGRLRIDP